MAIQINSPGWKIRPGASRGARGADDASLPGLPREFIVPSAHVAEEAVVEAAPPARGSEPAAETLDLSCDLKANESAVLVIRHQSGALTFHAPIRATTRAGSATPRVRFQVTVRRPATRGLVSNAVKAIVLAVDRVSADKVASFVLPRLASAVERLVWQKYGLKEGWVRVTRVGLAAKRVEPAVPASASRSLLLLHGTFSTTASAFTHLARSNFFDRVKPVYDDRIFGFDHFSVSRTPQDNARMLLEALPDQATTFDVITHSRGGLVLRSLVEQAKAYGELSRRFHLGRAVLVACPNEGTPLATPKRWRDTVGWLANLLEIFPDNPFVSGTDFVAHGLEWIANHASGDLPGLRSMDRDGELIGALQGPPGPPAGAYSALVANHQPEAGVLWRLLDAGLEQLFSSANDLVVPSEGGWKTGSSAAALVPEGRIGCFGTGGNLPGNGVTHVDFFAHATAVDFVVNAVTGRRQSLKSVDPRSSLSDRQVPRSGVDAAAEVAGVAAVGAHTGESLTPVRRLPQRGTGSQEGLRIVVINGDLTFETEPLLIGHYRSTRLTGSELAMDTLIGGTMAQSLAVGMYPQAPGAHQIFINRRCDLVRRGTLPRPKAVIVVGLGAEGKLQAADLVRSTRQAVIAWAQRVVEDSSDLGAAASADPEKGKTPRDRRFALSATLMGSGGTGVSAGQAACLIAQGVVEANERLHEFGGDDAPPRVVRLELTELYLDRATEAWRALRLQEAATPGRFQVDDAVAPGTGPLLRPPDTGYRGADYDYVSVESVPQSSGQPLLTYTLDTRRARSEVRAQRTQSQLLNDLIKIASNDQNHDRQLGRTLFNLLIPVELEAYLASSGTMQIELDPDTARVPWELLDTNDEDDRVRPPWSIRTRLIRKLRIEGFRDHVIDADADASALIIGEPKCPDSYPRLEGARREAVAVQACLAGALDETRVRGLISTESGESGPEALNIVNALFERPWRIVHVAGHGALQADSRTGGVVLSNGTFLGADEIRNMRAVPELVFVNCCHLASAESGAPRTTAFDRASFASGVAGALIEIGVRCVIAAGWAVDDDGASLFAETFYASMLRGRRFIDAVGEAREATHERSPHLNTWAAYQCYGDPDWVFVKDSAATQQPAEDFSGVGSATSLQLALMRNVVQTRFQGADPERQLASVHDLEARFGDKWGHQGNVAELFGEALVEAGDIERGMRWYERAVSAPDGTAPMKAAEQLSNVQARLGWEHVEKALLHRDTMRRQLEALPTGPGRARATGRAVKRAAAGSAGAARARLQAQAAARRAVDEAEAQLRLAVRGGWRLTRQALSLLNRLRAVDTSLERESLVGSVYKRQALIASAEGKQGEVTRYLREMERAYARAQEVGQRNGATDLYYPAVNRLLADVAINAGRPGWRGLNPALVDIVQSGLDAKQQDANFWIVVGAIELRQYQAMASRSLPAQGAELVRKYSDLHLRATSSRMWASVYDTARLAQRNYLAAGSAAEKKIAAALLDLLRGFAHRPDEGGEVPAPAAE